MSRLDKYLVENGFFETREKAQAAIRAGQVKVSGKVILKPSKTVGDVTIEIGQQVLAYVSRGGLKLERAMHEFKLNFEGAKLLDVGASTGGFTDVALQYGAEYVCAMDVGTAQLHASLRENTKVRSVENCHIRDFSVEQAGGNLFDFLVTDLSFISLTQVLEYFPKYLTTTGEVIALIKPQFELTEKLFIKNGIVKDFKHHIRAIEQVVVAAKQHGLGLQKLTYSPIIDVKKNVEYLACFAKKETTTIDVRKIVKETQQEHQRLKRL